MFAHECAVESVEQAQQLSRTRYFWMINYLTDYTGFDFLWEPVPWQSEYTHVWPSQWEQFYSAYLVPKHVDTIKYHIHDRVLPARSYPENFKTLISCDFDYSWVPHPFDPPYIYVFGNQWYQSEKMPTVEYYVPGATERKFVHYPRATLEVDMTHWKVPTDIDTGEFDFSWRPDPGSPPYIYQFATQHQKTGGPQYVVPGATDVKYIDQIRARISSKATAIIEIDHLDGNAGHIPNITKTVRYFDNYLDTLKRIAKGMSDEHEFVWICSSVCDYTEFDFSWHPEQWQATMLHVFASNEQKFGDTFFMHVPTFKYRSETCQLLDWYDVNYISTGVSRRSLPEIKHNYDSQAEAIKQFTWKGPLAVFTTDGIKSDLSALPAIPLWREKTKTIVPCSPGGEITVVPNTAIPYIKTQLYDYPYIDKTYRDKFKSLLQDVVFISYDEPDADRNWAFLKEQCPRAQRVHGVNGMERALEAAADISNTPWYYAVFAKTKIHESFDFSFVPDRMQQPKHYIFNSRNTVNGLEYGHMGIVMYNCAGIKQINQQRNFGLDYTLSYPHESIPMLSCYGSFDQSPYHTWRTAFRESAKLSYFEHVNPTVDGAYRLNVWLTVAGGDYAEWSIRGAEDGTEFFEQSGRNLDIIKQSFKWEWLRAYFVSKYGELE